MIDPRDLDVLELADLLREHLEDEWVPVVDELERRWFQVWAQQALVRLAEDRAVNSQHESLGESL